MKTILTSMQILVAIIISGYTLSSNTQNQNPNSINNPSIIDDISISDNSYQSPPLFITTMTHMEGNWHDDEIEAQFKKNVRYLQYGMDLFSKYSAKMTVESEKPFAQGSINWGINILQEVLDKGHGVGTHCDIGFSRPTPTFDEYVALLSENFFVSENEAVLRYFLSEVNSLVDRNIIQWVTQVKVYDAYLTWEMNQ